MDSTRFTENLKALIEGRDLLKEIHYLKKRRDEGQKQVSEEEVWKKSSVDTKLS